ncbi:MAG TPA: SPASM domain-containing protein, partial [Thermoanaerobaculia bacterium]|nr:SPASM domain-containing protein [Thermoanaerobaculia bacterium]
GLTREKVRLAKEAGLRSAGVSIDGLRDVHDRLRGVAGSYDRALAALGHLREFDIPFSVNTQITALAVPQLRELMHVVAATGAKNWQVQLTVAMGNAADHPEILLQPYQLLELMPLLASLHEEALDRGMLLQPGNNIGYFGPYEHRWRVTTDDRHWEGCAAGHTGLGIEADGTIKGCPSLATGPYAGGNVRTMTIEEIWNTAAQLRFARDRGTDELWGFCGSCYYADVCRGGCTWMAHSLFDRAGNNPYCHYRVLELAKAGLRERVEQVVAAPGESFDNGRFDLILEPLGGGEGERIAPPPALVRERPRRAENRIPQRLPLCRACEQFVRAEETRCPHCGCDLAEAQAAYDAVLPEILDATAALERLLADARRTSAG